MFLSTIRGGLDWFEMRYRDHRISKFPVAADEHFEETCERLATGGVHVLLVLPDDYYDEWD